VLGQYCDCLYISWIVCFALDSILCVQVILWICESTDGLKTFPRLRYTSDFVGLFVCMFVCLLILESSLHADFCSAPGRTDVINHYPLRVVKAYRWSRSMAPFLFKLVTRWECVVNCMNRPLYPWGRAPARNEQGAGSAADSVCTCCTRERSPVPVEIQTPDRPARYLVPVWT